MVCVRIASTTTRLGARNERGEERPSAGETERDRGERDEGYSGKVCVVVRRAAAEETGAGGQALKTRRKESKSDEKERKEREGENENLTFFLSFLEPLHLLLPRPRRSFPPPPLPRVQAFIIGSRSRHPPARQRRKGVGGWGGVGRVEAGGP